jgi:hypothetical protein
MLHTRTLAPLALCLSIGCYSMEQFQEDSATTRCALYEECGFLSALDVESYEACAELLRSEAYACVEYDPGAAAECIEALETLSCDEYGGGYFPMSCVDACVLADG